MKPIALPHGKTDAIFFDEEDPGSGYASALAASAHGSCNTAFDKNPAKKPRSVII